MLILHLYKSESNGVEWEPCYWQAVMTMKHQMVPNCVSKSGKHHTCCCLALLCQRSGWDLFSVPALAVPQSSENFFRNHMQVEHHLLNSHLPCASLYTHTQFMMENKTAFPVKTRYNIGKNGKLFIRKWESVV